MKIEFSFRNGTVFSVYEKAFLMQRSKTFGQVTIHTYSTRLGSIDLISLLESSLTFVALTNLQAFTKSFFGEDWFNSLGKKARMEIENEINVTKDFIKAYYDCFVRHKPNIQEAYVINEQIGDVTLFVVINHFQMTDILLDKLPKALVDTYGKISLGYLDIESKTCQLFPDFEQNEWRYLLSPTNNGFGNFVDRYYELSSNKVILIKSQEEFVKKFDLKEEDRYKLIINGLIER